MSDFDEAVNAVRAHSAAYQPVLRSWAAYLGDGDEAVIGSQANYYNCRYPTPESPAVEVYANGCPPNDGLRVMVGYSADQPDLIKIVSWNDSSRDDSSNDQVKRHGDQHYYLGGDTVWVDWRQITTFRVEPYSGLTVYVRGGVLPRAGADLQVVPQIVDLTSSVPGSASQARYALLSIDSTGAIIVTDGTTVTPIMSLDASDVPATPSGNFRIAAVALQYGQTTVTESWLQRDILDLRWPQESIVGVGVITPAMLANASAQYKYLVSGATPFAYAESAGALNIASGKTLTVSNSLTLASTDGLSLTISGNSTINGSLVGNITGGGTLATGGFTLTVGGTSSINGTAIVGTPGTLTVSSTNAAADPHTHAITSSSNPGVAAALLASSSSGGLQLVHAGLRVAPDNNILLYASHTWDGTTTQRGMYSLQIVQPASNSSQEALALQFGMRKAGNFNFGNLYGVSGSVADFGGAGTINNAYAIRGQISLNNASGTGGITNGYVLIAEGVSRSVGSSQTIGSLYGLRINGMGAAYVTNAFGLYIADQSNASSLNYSIYGNAGLYRFGDQLSIVGIADRSQLIVTGHTTQTVTVASIARADTAGTGVRPVLSLDFSGSGADNNGGSIPLLGRTTTTAAAAIARWAWSLPTGTHASYKGRLSGYVSDVGGERQWLQVDTDGASADVLINSLIYGSMYADDITQAVAVASANVEYEVGGSLTGGTCNGFTFQNSKELLTTVAGTYLANWSMSLSAGNNDHIAGGIMVNTTAQHNTENAAHTPGAGDQVGVSGTGIITLAVNDLVKLFVENESDADDIEVNHANLTLTRIGV